MSFPQRVRIVEVAPRDGLQNEAQALAVETRVSLIEALVESGIRAVECGSFVSPKWVPQMADSALVLQRLRRVPGVAYSVLVPNLKGLAAAMQAGAKEIAVFVAASETFSQRNINASIGESIERVKAVAEVALERDIKVRGYLSCTLGCPYEGKIELTAVARVARQLHDAGCYEVSLGDTVGVGTPRRARAMIEAVAQHIPTDRLAVHFHDTWGQGLANVFAVLEQGIAVVDASVAGIGGCPYAEGATGNVATEDLVYMLNGMGIDSGVDLEKLAAVGRGICKELGRTPASKAARAIEASQSLHC